MLTYIDYAFHSLCRGERHLLPEPLRSQLVCFHLDTAALSHPDSAYHRLSRIRVEEAYKRPHIVLFHDFLSDAECELLKSMAGKLLVIVNKLFI